MTNEHNYSCSIEHQERLTNKDKEYAAINLNETDEIRENAIAEIRRWIEDELHIQIDDFLILRFLRVCKFSLEKTKTRIRNYYKLQTKLPEWFINKDPLQPELQELLNLGLCLPLRKSDNQGRLVLLLRPTLYDPRIHKISDVFKINIMLTDLAMKNSTTASVHGCAMFSDVINPTISQIIQFGPIVLKNIVHMWQNCCPMRVQSINILNAPMLLDVSVKLLKSFMSEKMKSRFNIYSHMSPNCFKHVPVDILPIEYGGTDGTIQELTEYWKNLVEENRDWFMSDENDKIK